MSANQLDLTVQEFEDIPGSILMLNGAEYVIEEMIAEGGEVFVFPLRNRISQLVLYVAKIYKYKPGSKQLEKIKYDPPKSFEIQASLPDVTYHIEFYNIPGGLICFEEFWQSSFKEDHLNSAYHSSLMDTASSLANSKKYNEAVSAFDTVLNINPFHTHALINKGRCLIKLEKYGEALDLFLKVKRIDPNSRHAYFDIANYFLSIHHVNAAVHELQETIDRWKWDFEALSLQTEIAIDFDLPELASRNISEVLNVNPRSEIFVSLRDKLSISSDRAAGYQELLYKAFELQRKSEWESALSICQQAGTISKNNLLAKFNALICQYHLGNYTEVVSNPGSLLFRFDKNIGNHSFDSYILLLIICFFKNKELSSSIRFSGILFSRIKNTSGFPVIPTLVSGQSVEGTYGKESIEVLENLYAYAVANDEEIKSVGILMKRYRQEVQSSHRKSFS